MSWRYLPSEGKWGKFRDPARPPRIDAETLFLIAAVVLILACYARSFYLAYEYDEWIEMPQQPTIVI